MRVKEIRNQFLDYFESHGHEKVASSPVVPHEDPTLLFTNAGMNQFKGVFTGQETREISRAAAQKCPAGAQRPECGLHRPPPDLFEMLGNFSFGDYFKGSVCRPELITERFASMPTACGSPFSRKTMCPGDLA